MSEIRLSLIFHKSDKESLPILKTIIRVKEAMKDIKLIPSKWQPPNLRRVLTRAKCESNSNENSK